MTPLLSPLQVWLLADSRRKDARFGARQMRYNRQLRYYFGDQLGTQRSVWAMNSLGKPLQRVGTAMDIPRTVIANRVEAIIDDAQALIGRVPTSRTTPPSYDEEGIEKAEKQTRWLYSTYELSSLDLQQVQAGWYLSALGDACYMLEVDWDHDRRVVISVVDPQYCFPSWYRGHRKFELADLCVCYIETPDVLLRDYGYRAPTDKEEDTLVIHYVSPRQKTTVIGQNLHQPCPTAIWDLGFTPAVWVPNRITNGTLAAGDTSQVLDLQDIFNFALNVGIDGLVQSVYPMVGIKDPLTVGEDGGVEYGPGSAIALGDKGGIEVAQAGGNLSVLHGFMQQIEEQMNIGSGTTHVRQVGMPDRSNISGHAIKAAQGPESTRLDIKQIIMGSAFVLLNRYAFAMQEKAPLIGNHEFPIDGSYRGRTFHDRFMASRDIAGWYRTTVSFEALLGLSKPQKIAMAGQAKALRLVDDRTLMEWIGIDDPSEARKAIENDMIWEATTQAKAQLAGQQVLSSAQGGAPSAPSVGQPPSPPPGDGGGGPAQPPSPIRRPASGPAPAQGGVSPSTSGQPAPAGGAPLGGSLSDIREALQALTNLRGMVYAVGDLALVGRSPRPQLVITDWHDHALVMATLKMVAPTAKVTYLKEREAPDLSERVA